MNPGQEDLLPKRVFEVLLRMGLMMLLVLTEARAIYGGTFEPEIEESNS